MKKELIVGFVSALATFAVTFMLFNMPDLSGTASKFSQESLGMAARSEPAADEESGGSMLSYSLSMTMEVLSLETSESDVKTIVAGAGGYLVGASGNYDRENQLTLRFKVPTSGFEGVAGSLKELGKLEEESLSVYDVKSEYDEVAARIESLETERSRLIELFGRANETSDLVEISSRLSYVDSQLTYLNLREADITNQVEFTTLSLTLKEKMNPVSKFVFVGMASLVDEFSSGFNSSLSLMSRLVGVAVPGGALALVIIAALKFAKKKPKKRR